MWLTAILCVMAINSSNASPASGSDRDPATTQPAGSQAARHFETQRTITYDYLLYLPPDYGQDPAKKSPVILFLHGAGERGTDVNEVARHGPPKLLKDSKTELPLKNFIVISPQCPAGRWWQAMDVLAFFDEMMAHLDHADPDRVYLTGMSMGGFGTWEIATIAPEKFAAIAPVCGGSNPLFAGLLKQIPIWIFHGDKDPIIPVQRSIEMNDALKKAKADVRFTRYPNATHDSWTATYNNPELYTWFLSHSLSKRGDATAEPSTRRSP
jgi:predicted peptidase